MPIIKCAVIGTGYLGKFHAEKYTKISNTQLIAICDLDRKRAQEIAQTYHVSADTDYHELLGKVDAVSIASATTSHYAIAKDFLQHKTHVLLEKPITVTVAEAKELVTIAQQNQVILQVGHLERFNSAFLALREKITQPQIIIASRLAPYKPRGNDVSVVLDLMIHDIDLAQNLIGAKIKSLRSTTATVISPTPDFAITEITYENGCIARLTANRLSHYTERALTVIEKDAYFHSDLHHKVLTINRQDLASTTPAITTQEITTPKNDALFDEISAFIAAIINNSPPLVSGQDGTYALETAIKIEQNTL